jgi:eight-cysteine-cluster-containing protein
MKKTLLGILGVLGGLGVLGVFIFASQKELSLHSIITPTPSSISIRPTVNEKNVCKKEGCSGQICSDKEGIVTTCEYREEYGCYKTAICERQKDGKCGWTQTDELKACLQKANNKSIHVPMQ